MEILKLTLFHSLLNIEKSTCFAVCVNKVASDHWPPVVTGDLRELSIFDSECTMMAFWLANMCIRNDLNALHINCREERYPYSRLEVRGSSLCSVSSVLMIPLNKLYCNMSFLFFPTCTVLIWMIYWYDMTTFLEKEEILTLSFT